MDLAENSSEVLIDIKNATNINIEYASYDDYLRPSVVKNGKVSAPELISSNSICKTEAIFVHFDSKIPSISLEGRAYEHTYWGEGTRNVCYFSELAYYHGYNPASASKWFTIGADNYLYYIGKDFSELGGFGVNNPKNVGSNGKTIPATMAKQYPFGISGIQFRLNGNSDFSVVYQSYIKGIGWLPASCDGEENVYQHDKPISAFRMNIVPKTEAKHLMAFWNRDVGTN